MRAQPVVLGRKVQPVQDAQGLQQDDALGDGRVADDPSVAIGDQDGGSSLGEDAVEIRFAEGAAVLAAQLGQAGAQARAVEIVPAAGGQALERARQVGLPERFALARRAPVYQQRLPRTGVGGQECFVQGEESGAEVRCLASPFRQFDRRRQQLAEGQPATRVPVIGQAHRIHRAGNRGRAQAAHRQGAFGAFRERRGRRARAVDRCGLAGRRVVPEDEAVAPRPLIIGCATPSAAAIAMAASMALPPRSSMVRPAALAAAWALATTPRPAADSGRGGDTGGRGSGGCMSASRRGGRLDELRGDPCLQVKVLFQQPHAEQKILLGGDSLDMDGIERRREPGRHVVAMGRVQPFLRGADVLGQNGGRVEGWARAQSAASNKAAR